MKNRVRDPFYTYRLPGVSAVTERPVFFLFSPTDAKNKDRLQDLPDVFSGVGGLVPGRGKCGTGLGGQFKYHLPVAVVNHLFYEAVGEC